MRTATVIRSLGVLVTYPFLFTRVCLSLIERKNQEPELHTLVLSKRRSGIQEYIAHSKDLDVQDNVMQRTALHLSALKGYKEISELLVDSGASTQLKDKEGFTPLHLAALRGHDQIVQLLSPYLQSTDILGSLLADKPEIVKQYLDNGGDPNCDFGGLGSALYLSSKQGFFNSSEILLRNGADVNLFKTDKSPLHIAVINEHRRIIDLLLSYDADVNIHNGNRSPLHDAISNGQLEIVESLLDNSADPCVRDGFPFGNTPLHEAVLSGDISAVQLLLEHGADPFAKNWLGRKTPIDLAKGEMRVMLTQYSQNRQN